MRRQVVSEGADELTYEIRGIVPVARELQEMGVEIFWENIGDPVQKGCPVPSWMREVVAELVMDPRSYAYCATKGVPETREFLASRTNDRGGVRIGPDDITFFNGLGDAIQKVYGMLRPQARVIGPSPAYSTHSSGEASHASAEPLTYRLDPHNRWLPDLDDLRAKVRYNPNVVGLLVINPDNPTGMVHPREYMEEFVALAREYDLFLVVDEIYSNITYNGAEAVQLADVCLDVPSIALKGISKEFPWPGSRCGWMEVYNASRDLEFRRLVKAIDDSKMLEVCSTTLPQMAIPRLFSHPQYPAHRARLNRDIEARSNRLHELLSGIPGLLVNRTFGAFYFTVIFEEGTLRPGQSLPLPSGRVATRVEELVRGVPADKRFVYHLLGSTGICTVPMSGFASDLPGLRLTLLEEDPVRFESMANRLAGALRTYLGSA